MTYDRARASADRRWNKRQAAAKDEAARAMLAALQAIVDSADSVVDSWEHGDLAGAVNMLDADRDTAREAIAAAKAAGIK